MATLFTSFLLFVGVRAYDQFHCDYHKIKRIKRCEERFSELKHSHQRKQFAAFFYILFAFLCFNCELKHVTQLLYSGNGYHKQF